MRTFLVAESQRIGVSRTARHLGISRRTIYRWRHRAPDFADRPCRPHRSPQRATDALEASVLALRMERRGGPDRSWWRLGNRHRDRNRVRAAAGRRCRGRHGRDPQEASAGESERHRAEQQKQDRDDPEAPAGLITAQPGSQRIEAKEARPAKSSR